MQAAIERAKAKKDAQAQTTTEEQKVTRKTRNESDACLLASRAQARDLS